MTKQSDKYKYCNHHHEIDETYEVVNFGDDEFVANKDAVPLLKALNEAGLKTRTHHYAKCDDYAFVGLLLDNVDLQIRTVSERDADRAKYNGKKELIISWGINK